MSDYEGDDASIRFSLMELDLPGQGGRDPSPQWDEQSEHVLPVQVAARRSVNTVDLDVDPFVSDGWSVEEHKKGGMLDLDPAKIGFYLSKKQEGYGYIRGHKLCEELKDQPVLNANLLDFLLKKENQHLIPIEWKGQAVFFWGTVYCSSGGALCVRYLFWDARGRWDWGYRWLGLDWNSGGPAAVSAS